MVRNPYDGTVVGTVGQATGEQVDRAVAAAAEVAPTTAALPAHVRSDACRHVADRLAADAEQVAQLITAENGKPIQWARIEVARAVSTFGWAAEEARRFAGRMQRLDTDPGAVGRLALTRRFPIGPVLGITPFNFPLNLVAHKVAPAIAVGAPVVVKPAPATPLSALYLGELLAETGLPAGAFSVLPIPNSAAPALAADPRLPVVSFTGSDTVGWALREALPRKHVTLELGGNAAAILCEDWSDAADLDFACRRIATFGYYQAGQSCISVQRVLVHRSRYREVVDRLAAAVAALTTGDPTDPDCVVGPMISAEAAGRVADWIEEARTAGATVVVGGRRDGAQLAPTLLTDVPEGTKVLDREIFGPVVSVAAVDDLSEGIAAVNRSRFGLQAGVFTRRYDVAARAHRELAVGGVIIGDVPSFRADQMPYGGVKDSGVGREGVASAMEDYTQPRVMVLPDML